MSEDELLLPEMHKKHNRYKVGNTRLSDDEFKKQMRAAMDTYQKNWDLTQADMRSLFHQLSEPNINKAMDWAIREAYEINRIQDESKIVEMYNKNL